MKKILLVLLLLVLTVPSALGEGQKLACPFGADTPEAVLAGEAAELLALELLDVSKDDPAAAANLMLSQADTLLCDTQSVMLASLQGYTAEDLRTAMTPVCQVASCPLYLAVSASWAAELGIETMEGLLEYISANEYELLMARYTDASIEDFAAYALSDALAVLTDYYFPEEIIPALNDGEIQAAVLSGTDLAACDGEGLLPLMSLGEQRTAAYPDLPCAAELDLPVRAAKNLYLLASVHMSEDSLEALAESFPERSDALSMPQGYEALPLTGEVLKEQVAGEFSQFKRYMTAEGLFFYEE